MGSMNLDDIVLTPLACMAAEGGDVLHAMKESDTGYRGFGEAYFSLVKPGYVKAWKRHMRMTMNLVVPIGKVRFVFYRKNVDGRDIFRVEEIGEGRYARITVPPGIWFGFKGIARPTNLILNVASLSHDPGEVERKSLSEINYDWG